MITLYIDPHCPFCRKTVDVAKEVGMPLTLKDIHHAGVEAELLTKGGKRQMPFMVDDERNISMYESADIMQYLKDEYQHEK